MSDYHKIINLYPVMDMDLLQLEMNYDVSLQKLIIGAIDMELKRDNRQFRMPTVKRNVPSRDDQKRSVYLSISDPAQIEYVRSITKGFQTLYIKAILRKHICQYLEHTAFGCFKEDTGIVYVDMPLSGRKALARKKRTCVEPEYTLNETKIHTNDTVQTSFEKFIKDDDEQVSPELHVTELKDYFEEGNKALLNKGKSENKSEKMPIKKEHSADMVNEEPCAVKISQTLTEDIEAENKLKIAEKSPEVPKDEKPSLMKWLDGDY